MDHEKINYDLVVAILEWIVGEEHEVCYLFSTKIKSERNCEGTCLMFKVTSVQLSGLDEEWHS